MFHSPAYDEPRQEAELRPITRSAGLRTAPLGVAVLLRAAFAFLALAVLGAYTLPAFADEAMRLRGDVTARGDVLTLEDLVEGAPSSAAKRPLFRAPALGATGTIQARRILEAVAALNLGAVETGGRLQVAVQRAARRVGAQEIEAALRRALETAYGVDAKSVSVRLDGDGPMLLAPVDLDGQVVALDLNYDPRSRRVGGLMTLGERQASLRVSGVVIEMRDVAIVNRTLNRGEPVTAADLTIERRPREGSPPNALASGATLVGEVAQRTLSQGAILRTGDTAPPELVARGEAVTIVYESPGISLAMRGQATDAGRLGATVNVVNIASKKVLQAIVIGPGRVSVGPAPPQRQASAEPPTTLR
ncbi:flagellar basal body P-ring formation protein FlgA [Methylobacterium sp. WL30]|uniref:flagellar basal body P-ring formation chaperone FlgA n=1 Tax=unclassified Methylobacterium TaxID=2615210 RepID=UPI0011C720E6|nr:MULTISPECIES: flagellar basal body P-ring formation chaperone FlgA [unclassified Methylobacterium]TXM91057.1 flagellar basal body P-ring formation protein FlgA [Methylobacterium sp. WL116]TXN40052.1 flagellar basal body P-ring formation protein FlgA [Methylobacterium sp. WL93]TXN53226.1 flagellar basal body P-ring formation protein FlgA [Methylobacterium sp. WL119]TXN69210.1 flagellar basal body P-ring formation protein FlgA [Methylobacterium sp. WL30]